MHATLLLVNLGGNDRLSLRFIISSPTWPVLCFSVMSDLNLDNPGFQSPGAPILALPSSGSSSDSAADRRTCITSHRWMSKKTVILYVFHAAVLIVTLTIVARNARNGWRMRCCFMLNIAALLSLSTLSLRPRLLLLLRPLLCLPRIPLRVLILSRGLSCLLARFLLYLSCSLIG